MGFVICIAVLISAAGLQLFFPKTRLELTNACQYCNLDGENLAGWNLQHASLHAASLVNADLRAANFYGANLTNSTLRGANIRGASFDNATLRNSDLRQVRGVAATFIASDMEASILDNADLRKAKLRFVNLRGASLKQTLLSRANLEGAHLDDVSAPQVDLRASNLRTARFVRAKLSQADIRGAKLNAADLRHSNMTAARLLSADLSGSQLEGANLTTADLRGADLTGVDLRAVVLEGANLSEAKLENTNLANVDLRSVTLVGSFLGSAILEGTNLRGVDLTRVQWPDARLVGADLTGADLGGVKLSVLKSHDIDLRKIQLDEVDLRDLAFQNFVLTDVDFANAYLYDADLRNLDLRRSDLSKARLSGANLSGSNLGNGKLDMLGRTSDTKSPLEDVLIDKKALRNLPQITAFSIDENDFVMTSKGGLVYRLNAEATTTVLNLNDTTLFTDKAAETGLLSVARYKNSWYLSFTEQAEGKGDVYLVVNEYDLAFRFQRTIARIYFPTDHHHGGTLIATKHGQLYLSTGDGGPQGDPHQMAQNLDSLRGKILRFDLHEAKPEPIIIAYGLRNPWKFSIDERQRMFVADVGHGTSEAVYLLPDLSVSQPYNLGWPFYEGSKLMIKQLPLPANITDPIFEYSHNGGRGVIGGYFLDELNLYIVADYLGHVRLLKPTSGHRWKEIYYQALDAPILSLGYDAIDKVLYMSSWETIFRINLARSQLTSLPAVTLCKTVMPSGDVNDSDCK
jgi:uncharacterized protein YjbI with pentapeptide repeats